jgi:hypothetical protein
MNASLLTSTHIMRTAQFHAHCTPWRARRACSRTSSRAATSGAPLAPARSANTRASPLRSTQQAAPRIAAASRVLSLLCRRPHDSPNSAAPRVGFLSHTGGAGISGLGASAPDPRGGRPKKAGTQKVAKIEAQKNMQKKIPKKQAYIYSPSACEPRARSAGGGGGVSGGSGAGPARGEPAARREGVVASRMRPASALRAAERRCATGGRHPGAREEREITHGQGMAGEVAYMGLYDVLRDVS